MVVFITFSFWTNSLHVSPSKLTKFHHFLNDFLSRFWRVVFTTDIRFLALKREGNVVRSNGHQFREVKFWSFLVNFTTDNRFLALKHEGNVVRSNGHQFWEVKFWTFLVNFTTNNRFLALKHEGNVVRSNGHQFREVKLWSFFGQFYHW